MSARADVAPRSSPGGSFRHEALLYRDVDELLEAVVPFAEGGLAAGEAVLVAAPPERIELLRAELGEPEGLHYEDMYELGRNPGRILSAWWRFREEHTAPGQRVRGVGEPVWSGRGHEETLECVRHEAVLNLAFTGTGWPLLCPYDVSRLDPAVVEHARLTHPAVIEHGDWRPSGEYAGPEGLPSPLTGPLPEPPGRHETLTFELEDLPRVRRAVERWVAAAGLAGEQIRTVALAVTEVAANSIRHGGGHGTLRVWEEADRVVCEVRDDGVMTDPLVGRRPPAAEHEGGRGLWLAHQLCDLVQVRSSRGGTAVRLHVERR